MSDENNPALLDRVVTGYPRTKTADKLTAPAFVRDLEVMMLVNDEFSWMGEIQDRPGDHRSPTSVRAHVREKMAPERRYISAT